MNVAGDAFRTDSEKNRPISDMCCKLGSQRDHANNGSAHSLPDQEPHPIRHSSNLAIAKRVSISSIPWGTTFFDHLGRLLSVPHSSSRSLGLCVAQHRTTSWESDRNALTTSAGTFSLSITHARTNGSISRLSPSKILNGVFGFRATKHCTHHSESRLKSANTSCGVFSFCATRARTLQSLSLLRHVKVSGEFSRSISSFPQPKLTIANTKIDVVVNAFAVIIVKCKVWVLYAERYRGGYKAV